MTFAALAIALSRASQTSFVVWGPLQVGTKLAPIYVRRTGLDPDVEMRGQLAAQPALQQGVLMAEWIEKMPRIVSNLLGELSDPPTKLLAKLGGPVPSG